VRTSSVTYDGAWVFTRMFKFAFLIVLAAGCSSEPPSKRSEPPPKTAHISTLITGAPATLPEDVASSIGMTEAEFKEASRLGLSRSQSSKTVEAVGYKALYVGGKVAQIILDPETPTDLAPMVTEKWGAPRIDDLGYGEKRLIWTNPTTKLHAWIRIDKDEQVLRFGAVVKDTWSDEG
jgi:hypothetical protein